MNRRKFLSASIAAVAALLVPALPKTPTRRQPLARVPPALRDTFLHWRIDYRERPLTDYPDFEVAA